MINTKELRIGNKLYYRSNPIAKISLVTVSWVSNDSLSHCEMHEASYPQSTKQYEGIPLTEEWLRKFGFEDLQPYRGQGSEIVFGKTIVLDKELSQRFVFILSMQRPTKREFDGNYTWVIPHYNTEIDFVHQLQNAFYSLTGIELTIKE